MKKLSPKLSPKVSQNFEQILNKISGKRVFIFDLETTGLFDFKQSFKYWDNKIFDSARIIEIGYYYSDNFGNDFETNNTDPLYSPSINSSCVL
jgi:hypothetical protein